MARPTKYNETIEKLICDRLRIGATRRASYESSGVPERTFFDWLARYPQFSQAVTRAEAEAELRFTSRLTKEVGELNGDWRAAESWLKRRRRMDWGDSLDVRKLDDETLLRLLGLASGGGTEGAAITDSEYVREG